MTAPAIVSVDAGTSTIKAAAFALDGEGLAKRSRPTPTTQPRTGWIEQDMHETWDRAAATVQSVVEAIDREILAVGVTGQGSGAWLIDEDGKPVRNAILWTDSRAAPYVQQWREDGTFDVVFDRCGYGLFSGAPLALYRWLAEEEPSTVERTETALFCKDWIKYRFTGARTTDPSDVSITHYRPDAGTFDDDIAERLGATALASRLPDCEDGTAIVGHVTEEAAGATGVPAGTPVVSGTVDVAASAFGCGAASPGDSSSVVGTTLQNQVTLSSPAFEPPRAGYTLDTGVENRGIRAMGAMTGTPNIDWLRETVFDGADWETIEDSVASVSPGAEGVMFHPYLNSGGEKAPFVDPTARAQFTGLTMEHSRAHLARAVYEGVALAIRDCYEHVPGETDRVYVSGGGARSELWCQLFADQLNAEIHLPAGEEFGAKGVALLAGIAVDHYDGLEDAVGRTTTIDRVFRPRHDVVERMDRWYEVYRTLRSDLRDSWERRQQLLSDW